MKTLGLVVLGGVLLLGSIGCAAPLLLLPAAVGVGVGAGVNTHTVIKGMEGKAEAEPPKQEEAHAPR